MGVDPELREYLEAVRREIGGLRGEMVARFDQVDRRTTGEVAALREEMVIGHDALHKVIQEGDRQTRVLVEGVHDEVRGVVSGLAHPRAIRR